MHWVWVGVGEIAAAEMSCGFHSVRARYSGSVTPRPQGEASSVRSGMATFSGSISRSSHYSSSSVRAESASRAALAFQPYLDAGCRRLFGNEGTEDHLNLSAFNHCGECLGERDAGLASGFTRRAVLAFCVSAFKLSNSNDSQPSP